MINSTLRVESVVIAVTVIGITVIVDVISVIVVLPKLRKIFLHHF